MDARNTRMSFRFEPDVLEMMREELEREYISYSEDEEGIYVEGANEEEVRKICKIADKALLDHERKSSLEGGE